MTPAVPALPPASRTGRIRSAGAALVVVLAALIAAAPQLTAPLREAGFDGYQAAFPRAVGAIPALVVEIDARSLAALGRWPWPRSRLAELVTRINAMRPAALGIDILMPESDPLSPERAAPARGPTEPGAVLANDALLARALADAPAVVAVAGMPERSDVALRAPPFVIQGAPAGEAQALPELRIERFAGALTSIEAINAAATGWGLVSANPETGVIRRVPLVASIDGTLIGALALEMFRVAYGAPMLRLLAVGRDVRAIAIGPVQVATEPDGSARVYFSLRHKDRFVSAIDVLEGRVDADRLQRKLVLVAVTGLGLGDFHATPVGERMPGSEIHAQLLENLFEGSLLVRPGWAPVLEAGIFVALAALVVWATPVWSPRRALALVAACVAAALAASLVAFRAQHLVFDAATPALSLLLVYGSLLVATLTEVARQRRALEAALQRQREHAARIAGELHAARRIQLASLPRAAALDSRGRVDLAAAMRPAREVGGDLYDFYLLDACHLLIVVGDVAGKGLSASIFMAVSKALYKSAALRMGVPDPGALMRAANAEVSRDNPEQLFVTAFAAILDLECGVLRYCNAGHENPFRLAAGGARTERIGEGDGPPLCAVDDFAYASSRTDLAPCELVCIVSDGVTETRGAGGELYGGARVAALLQGDAQRGRPAQAIVDALLAEVDAFAALAEPVDDITVLALRWNGPAPPASPRVSDAGGSHARDSLSGR